MATGCKRGAYPKAEGAWTREQGRGTTMTRADLETWLLRNSFIQVPAGKTSHKQFVLGGCKVTVPGHGPKDLSKKHLGMVLRALESVGFDRAKVRREWENT